MKIQTSEKTIVSLLLAGAFVLTSLAQDGSAPKKEEKPDEAKMMAQMMELAKPGENHKVLQGLVGTWKYTLKMWMSPDPKAPPSETSGETVVKPIMGGRYFQSDHSSKIQMPGADGKMMEMDFKGLEIAGYDNAKKIFVSSWVDNMGTGIMFSEGSYDPATKTLTYTSETEMIPGMKTKVRELIKFTDDDHHVFEFYENRGGTEVKTMEISSTRKG